MRGLTCFALTLGVACALAQEKGPGNSAHVGAQAVADAIRQFTGADAAFVPAKHIKASYDKNDLATVLQYPTDTVVLVRLTGAEIRAAFERSAALYPQVNLSFLQISGFIVEISSSALPEKRVLSVKTEDGSAFDAAKSYQIAMPAMLGRGGMGYFNIWDKNKIAKAHADKLEDILRGKSESASSPRWVVRS